MFLPKINEWQYYDKNNDILPWYASGFLDVLLKWDVSDWNVLEYGAGWSTIWWAKHCKNLISIEHNEEWHQNCCKQLEEENLLNKAKIILAKEDEYINVVDSLGNAEFDCIIVDGLKRTECLGKAVSLIKKDGVIIVDDSERCLDVFNRINVRTPSEYVYSEALNILRYNECHTYVYEGSTLSRTTYWKIANKESIVTDAYKETQVQIEKLKNNPRLQYKV
jgi:hypothetical protein